MSVYTHEMHMRKKLNELSLSDTDMKTILDEFIKTKDQYFRKGILSGKLQIMPFREIIKIIAEKNGIKI